MEGTRIKWVNFDSPSPLSILDISILVNNFIINSLKTSYNKLPPRLFGSWNILQCIWSALKRNVYHLRICTLCIVHLISNTIIRTHLLWSFQNYFCIPICKVFKFFPFSYYLYSPFLGTSEYITHKNGVHKIDVVYRTAFSNFL